MLTPYDQHQNAPIEALWGRLKLKVAANLAQANLSNQWWYPAALHANHTIDRLPSTSNIEQRSPYELWTGRPPARRHLRMFGASAYVWDPDFAAGGDRAQKGMFIYYPAGYADGTVAVYMPKSKRIRVSAHVVFDETDGFAMPSESVGKHMNAVLDKWERRWTQLKQKASPILLDIDLPYCTEAPSHSIDEEGNIHTTRGSVIPKADPVKHQAHVQKKHQDAIQQNGKEASAESTSMRGERLSICAES